MLLGCSGSHVILDLWKYLARHAMLCWPGRQVLKKIHGMVVTRVPTRRHYLLDHLADEVRGSVYTAPSPLVQNEQPNNQAGPSENRGHGGHRRYERLVD